VLRSFFEREGVSSGLSH